MHIYKIQCSKIQCTNEGSVEHHTCSMKLRTERGLQARQDGLRTDSPETTHSIKISHRTNLRQLFNINSNRSPVRSMVQLHKSRFMKLSPF